MDKGQQLSKLMTRHEAAAVLGICERTLRGHVQAGSIKFITVGRGEKRPKLMFDPADLQAFIDHRRGERVPPTLLAPAPRRRASSASEPIGFLAMRELRLAALRKP